MIKVCLLLQKKVFCKSTHRWLSSQKIHKLRQTKWSQSVYFSPVLREWEETKTKYSAPKLVTIWFSTWFCSCDFFQKLKSGSLILFLEKFCLILYSNCVSLWISVPAELTDGMVIQGYLSYKETTKHQCNFHD